MSFYTPFRRCTGLVIFSSALCHGQLITTIAGGGTNYAMTNGIPGAQAAIGLPQGIATDSAGNVYYYDAQNYVVRQVNPQGIVNTVAGGKLGYVLYGNLGDGGPATAAGLGPQGIFAGLAVDAVGNLYISDPGNNRVRKVDTTGIITTFAGGAGPFSTGDGGKAGSAGLESPAGLAVDSGGNLYIADYQAGNVRMVDTQGIIHTYAGGGSGGDGSKATSAQVLGPYGLAFDNQGNLYIAQATRVRMVNSQGILSTVAGGTTAGDLGNGGAATSAEFLGIQGLAVDTAGDLYISDNGNYQVRVVKAGQINAAVGNGKLGSTGDGGYAVDAEVIPTGLAIDSSGNLYVGDSGGGAKVRKVNFSKKPAGITLSASQLYFATTVAHVSSSELAQYVEIQSVNGPQFSYTASATTQSGGNWLTVGSSGTTGTSTAVSIGTSPTTAGTYKGTVTFTPTQPDYPPVQIQVTYVIGATAPALPVITDVENGASFQSGYIGGAVWTIKGTNLASVATPDNWNSSILSGVLPTSLDGVTVLFGEVPAYISYLSSTQINVVTPSSSPDPGSVQVINNGAASASFEAAYGALYSPAFFTWPQNQVVATRTDYSYAVAPGTFAGATTVAAKPGDVLILWGTGFGATTPAVGDGVEVPSDQEYATSATPAVTINGVSATVYGAALAAGYAGLYQVAIQVPTTLTAGTYPIVATMGQIFGVSSPNNVMLAVQP